MYIPRHNEEKRIPVLHALMVAEPLATLVTLGGSGLFPETRMSSSSDAAVAQVAGRHGVSYVDPGRNLGFGAGVNAGCVRRDGRDVLLLNPDAVITPEAARALHAAIEIDEPVPAEHFKAVAHVIGYVMRLQGKLPARAS